MQTVSFQCGHCHKVMGVTAAFLGKQVRCPHCQQVVLAPAQAPASAPAPPPGPSSRATPDPTAGFSAPPPQKDEHESIFGEHIDEDLFGGGPKAHVEMPEPAKQNLQLEPTVFQMPALPQDLGGSSLGATVASNSSAAVADQRPVMQAPMQGPSLSVAPAPTEWSTPGVPAPEQDGMQAPQPITSRPAPQSAAGTNMILVYALVFLGPYALFMTGIAIYFYSQSKQQIHPLELLPDDGEPKAVKGQPSARRVVDRIQATAELPPQLKVPLGQKIRIGDLEVTPEKIEAKTIAYKTWGNLSDATKATEGESLVLHLHLKNVSKDTSFRPVDPYWERKWEEDDPKRGTMPYTYLSANNHNYGGVLPWDARIRRAPNGRLIGELLEGQEENQKILKPGEEMRTIIATLPDKDLPRTLGRVKEPMVWRVQLRRGLVEHKGKEISTTAVVGVDFDMSKVQKVQ